MHLPLCTQDFVGQLVVMMRCDDKPELVGKQGKVVGCSDSRCRVSFSLDEGRRTHLCLPADIRAASSTVDTATPNEGSSASQSVDSAGAEAGQLLLELSNNAGGLIQPSESAGGGLKTASPGGSHPGCRALDTVTDAADAAKTLMRRIRQKPGMEPAEASAAIEELVERVAGSAHMSLEDVVSEVLSDVGSCSRASEWEEIHTHVKMRLLSLAAQHDSTEAVSRLLDAKARVDGEDRYARSALWHAAANGNPEMAQRLLAAGAAFNHADRQGFTALGVACLGGHESSARLLLEAHASVDGSASQRVMTPLMLACRHGHLPCVNLLIGHGADVHRKLQKVAKGEPATALEFAEAGSSMLHNFCANQINDQCNLETMLELDPVRRPACACALPGFRPDTKAHRIVRQDAQIPLHKIKKNQQVQEKEHRRQRDEQIERAEKQLGLTPAKKRSGQLQHAVRKGNVSLLTKWLRDGGRELIAKEDADILPPEWLLTAAAFHGHVDIIAKLLKNKASPDPLDSPHGNFPLLAASSSGVLPCVKALVEAGAKVDRRSSNAYPGLTQRTAAEQALAAGHAEVHKYLREQEEQTRKASSSREHAEESLRETWRAAHAAHADADPGDTLQDHLGALERDLEKFGDTASLSVRRGAMGCERGPMGGWLGCVHQSERD